ncbi:MAG: NADPH-dependent curcumin reductase CurA [Acidimicrobiales bacterium]|jgi:NADPH-dependent curcumin reductase CurA
MAQSCATSTNQRVILLRRPEGLATPDHFEVQAEELSELEPDMVRVGVEYLSIDAGLRTKLQGEGFHSQVGVGEVLLTHGVGRIIESNDADWPVGQAVLGRLGAQTVTTIKPGSLAKIEDTGDPLSRHLGALGISTGVTAWVGVRTVAKPKAGDVFAVSAAAGAVGSLVGQIAKRDGAYVIGIAGGPEKCAYLVDTLGFDAAIDYKNEDVGEQLSEFAPQGLNIFYDNVGGDILDAALDNMAMRAKIVICGAISQYDDMSNVTGPSRYLRLAERQSTMEGFAVFHFPEAYEQATADLTTWLNDGSLIAPEHVLEGIESFPEALQFMFSGGNIGKLMVKVS